MGSDNDINKPLLKVSYSLFLLGGGSESGHKVHPYREVSHSLGKSIVMLLGKDCGRNKNCHLFSVLESLEGCADCNLCFSKANVSADKSVHDPWRLHVSLGVLDGCQLILCLLIGKSILELLLPDGILAEFIAGSLLPLGVELHQILSHLFNGSLNLTLGVGPVATSKLVELGLVGGLIISAGGIFLNNRKACGQHVEIAATAVLDLDIILNHMVRFDLLDSSVYSKAVVLVNHVVTYLKVSKVRDLLALILALFLLAFFYVLGKNVALSDNCEFDLRIFKAL